MCRSLMPNAALLFVACLACAGCGTPFFIDSVDLRAFVDERDRKKTIPRFVAVGDGGEAWWSPDGVPDNWSDSGPGGTSLLGIAFGLLEN